MAIEIEKMDLIVEVECHICKMFFDANYFTSGDLVFVQACHDTCSRTVFALKDVNDEVAKN